MENVDRVNLLSGAFKCFVTMFSFIKNAAKVRILPIAEAALPRCSYQNVC